MKIGAPAQVGSSGPKRVKVTVPVGGGAGEPVTVAVSEMGLPMVTGVVADVAMVALVDRPTPRWARRTGW